MAKIDFSSRFNIFKEKVNDKIAAHKLKKNYHKNKGGMAKEQKSKTVFFTIYMFLFLFQSFLCIYPLFWTLMNSFKHVTDYLTNFNGLPTNWDWALKNWIDAPGFMMWRGNGFWTMAFNSVWFAFGTQFLNILASILVAYPLARYNFPGKKFFYGIIIFRIIIPIIGTGSTGYKLQRALGMINNPPVYLLGAFQGFDMNALIMYGYMKAVDRGYSEAAFIDGATTLQTLFQVVLPQAFPCVIALYVSAVMGQWNNYQAFMISLPNYPNLALGIYELQQNSNFGNATNPNGKAMYFAVCIMSAAVPMVLFTAAQKTMLTNMSIGGLKG
ncbi:MAG: carbohydrate ABC transporter permease [Clostridia bacterium]|nr:carbohydrate ABC transporter permease [Clostridia bacterium]